MFEVRSWSHSLYVSPLALGHMKRKMVELKLKRRNRPNLRAWERNKGINVLALYEAPYPLESCERLQGQWKAGCSNNCYEKC